MSTTDLNSLQESTHSILTRISRDKCYNYPSFTEKLSGVSGVTWLGQAEGGLDDGSLTPDCALTSTSFFTEVANWLHKSHHLSSCPG